MKNENLSLLKGKKKVINKGHAEFISASSTQVVSQGQQLQSSKILNQVQNDFINKKAFTLIELLVVVLIIGILAAVALPQYQIAVEKARAAEAVVNLRLVVNALELYHLENGVYPASLQELSIDLPHMTNYHYVYNSNLYIGVDNALEASSGRRYMIAHLLDHRTQWTAEKKSGVCSLTATDPGTNSIATTLCKQMCGVSELKTVWGSGEKGCKFDDFSRKS